MGRAARDELAPTFAADCEVRDDTPQDEHASEVVQKQPEPPPVKEGGDRQDKFCNAKQLSVGRAGEPHSARERGHEFEAAERVCRHLTDQAPWRSSQAQGAEESRRVCAAR